MMFGAAILILTFVRLLLVKGVETNNGLVEIESEIGSNSTRRILYGTRARPKDFPSLVGIRASLTKRACGGSVIAGKWIMTAAHCVHQEPCSGIVIFPAAWKRPQNTHPSQCNIHKQYRPGNYEYDIALLRVSQDLLSDGRMKKISLPPPGRNYPPDTPVTIVGWGMTEERKHPFALLRATVYVDKWETCNTKYLNNHDRGTREIPLRVLCLQGKGSSSPPSGSCMGDSGGPATTTDGYVIGIGSFILRDVSGFCMIGGPSMFVNVVDYLPWIYSFVDPQIDTTHFRIRSEHTLS